MTVFSLFFSDTNRDVIPDDLVLVFNKEICNFGFATHLFGNEIKAMHSMQANQATAPGAPRQPLTGKGVRFRIGKERLLENYCVGGSASLIELEW